ncbi:MAG: peptide chain release factor N(5)-glutamine methyltransferase [Acidobacteriaceae bacterium]
MDRDARVKTECPTVEQTLRRGMDCLGALESARRDAELLLMRAAGRDRAWLMTHADSELRAELTVEQAERFEEWVARRARQEPVQYILGEQEFCGFAMKVTPAVLIPRPETEHLVEAVIARVGREAPVTICDVGTGSGAIAIALAKELPRAEVAAVDVSRAALEIAQENTERHGVAERVRLAESDLMSAVRGERFDVVVSNPPYVGEGEVLEAQVRDWEPHGALFAGETGLEVYRKLIPGAWEALAAGGWLVMEMGQGQRDAIAGLLAGWDEVSFLEDLQGIPRVAIARRGGGE